MSLVGHLSQQISMNGRGKTLRCDSFDFFLPYFCSFTCHWFLSIFQSSTDPDPLYHLQLTQSSYFCRRHSNRHHNLQFRVVEFPHALRRPRDPKFYCISEKKEDNWKPLIVRVSLPSSFAWVFFDNISANRPWQSSGQFQKSPICFFHNSIYTVINQSVSHYVWTGHVPVDHDFVRHSNKAVLSKTFQPWVSIQHRDRDKQSRIRLQAELSALRGHHLQCVVTLDPPIWVCEMDRKYAHVSPIVYIFMSKWSCRCRFFPRLVSLDAIRPHNSSAESRNSTWTHVPSFC